MAVLATNYPGERVRVQTDIDYAAALEYREERVKVQAGIVYGAAALEWLLSYSLGLLLKPLLNYYLS